ncbi:MAG: hypothetical protein ABIG60_03160 [Patescibacteria group bacterium]
MQTYVPFNEETMGFIPYNLTKRDGEESGMVFPHRGGFPVYTGEDVRAGCVPDDFDGLLNGGWFNDQEVDNAAYLLLCSLGYNKLGVCQTYITKVNLPDEITDELMEVGRKYVENGNGVDGLVKFFIHSLNKGIPETCCLIIDFCRRLREYLKIQSGRERAPVLEVTAGNEDLLKEKRLNGKARDLYFSLAEAIGIR